MEVKTKDSDLIWLDEAFAKKNIDILEAACCLVGCDEENIKVNDVNPIYLHPSDILHPEVSRVFEIIKTWVRHNTRKTTSLVY
jgi:hypothetical protein